MRDVGARAAVGEGVTREHGWVRHDGHDVFVSVTLPPDARVRGAVAFVGPLGTEAEFSHRATVRLAAVLAERGIATVRVDPPGTGDSCDCPDPGPAAWPGLVTGVAREVIGTEVPLGHAGLRLGAVVASEAAARDASAAFLLLWDPIDRVRRHLRATSALLGVSTGHRSADDGSLALPGVTLGPAAVRQLCGLSARAHPGDLPTLVLTRPDAGPGTDRYEPGPGADSLELALPAATVSPEGFVSIIPASELDAAAAWIDDRLPAVEYPLETRIPTSRTVRGATGSGFVETVTRSGPTGPVIVTARPLHRDDRTGACVVFHHAATFPRQGPGRLWTRLSRELAADGVTAVRWDRRGVGDAGLPEAGEITPIYGAARYEDAEEVLAGVEAPDEEITLVGVCSGGLAAAVTALAHPRMRVVYVAPQAWNPDMPEVGREDLARAGWDPDTGRPPRRPRSGLARRAFDHLRRHHPYALWVLLARTGLTQIPGRLLVPLSREGVRLTLLFPRMDWPLFLADHGERGLRAARRRGWDCEIVHLAGEVDDHNLWSPAYLDEVATEIRRVATVPWAPVAGGPVPGVTGREYPAGPTPRPRTRGRGGVAAEG